MRNPLLPLFNKAKPFVFIIDMHIVSSLQVYFILYEAIWQQTKLRNFCYILEIKEHRFAALLFPTDAYNNSKKTNQIRCQPDSHIKEQENRYDHT